MEALSGRLEERPPRGERFRSRLERVRPAAPYALFLFFFYAALVYWLRHCWLSPDSTNYLAAAANLVRHGRMSVFTNWPDMTLRPVAELYTVQPCGFPLYLAGFIVLFRDPFLAGVIAQAAAIAVFFLGVWRFARLAGLKIVLQGTLLAIITTFLSFGEIFAFLWTETLFLGIMAFLFCSVYRYSRPDGTAKDLAVAAGLLLAGASIRFAGIFSLGFFIPALWQRKLKFRAFLGLGALALLPNVIWHFRNKLATGANFESHYTPGFSGQTASSLQNIVHSLKYSLAFDQGWALLALAGCAVALAWASRPRPPAGGGRPDPALRSIVLAGALAYLAGMTAVALASGVGSRIRPQMEQARLLAPAYFLFFLWVHAALNVLPGKGYAAGLAVLLALMGNPHSFAAVPRMRLAPRINIPAEARLWPRIRDLEPVRRAAYFYSDDDFTHQVFSGKLQRILWSGAAGFGEGDSSQQACLAGLRPDGGHPFFLFQERSAGLIAVLEKQMAAAGLRKREFPDLGFRLYYGE